MTTAINDFVRQVERACADLPEPQRRKLLVDLEDHLGELDADGIADLGDPGAYAAELRAALNLPSAPPPGAAPAQGAPYVQGAPHPQGMATQGTNPPVAYPSPPPRRTGTWIVVGLCIVGAGMLIVTLLVGIVLFGLSTTSQSTSPTSAPAASAQPIPLIEVPSLVGQTQALATRSAQAVGLDVQVELVPATAPRGQVVAQDPQAHTQVAPGSTIVLRVSTGK